jgi:hypothetical protein
VILINRVIDRYEARKLTIFENIRIPKKKPKNSGKFSPPNQDHTVIIIIIGMIYDLYRGVYWYNQGVSLFKTKNEFLLEEEKMYLISMIDKWLENGELREK